MVMRNGISHMSFFSAFVLIQENLCRCRESERVIRVTTIILIDKESSVESRWDQLDFFLLHYQFFKDK